MGLALRKCIFFGTGHLAAFLALHALRALSCDTFVRRGSRWRLQHGSAEVDIPNKAGQHALLLIAMPLGGWGATKRSKDRVGHLFNVET